MKKSTPSLFCCETLLEIEQTCSFIDQTAGLSAMQNSNIGQEVERFYFEASKRCKMNHCVAFSVLIDPELTTANISMAF